MTANRIRAISTTKFTLAGIVWGTLGLLTLVFAAVFVYGLLRPEDTAAPAAAIPRCVDAEIAYMGRVHTTDGQPIANAVVTLHRVGALESCVRHDRYDEMPDILAEPTLSMPFESTPLRTAQQLRTDDNGQFRGAVRTLNDALFRLTVEAEGYDTYESPNFSATYLPYWQFKVITLQRDLDLLG